MIFVPRRLRYRRAHDNALKQFLARNVHITTARTGVLIFVSLAERYAEVVADSGINAKVPQETWNDIVADLVAHAQPGPPRRRLCRGDRCGRRAVVGAFSAPRRRPQRTRRSSCGNLITVSAHCRS